MADTKLLMRHFIALLTNEPVLLYSREESIGDAAMKKIFAISDASGKTAEVCFERH